MAEALETKKDAVLSEQYELLIKQLKSLLSKDERLITNLANLTAAIKQTFDKVSWVGFYLFDGEILYLGPFQGKVACTTINLGKGVCGKAAEKGQTIIVPDVNKFPGHIFCDPDSKSEIVVPMFKNNTLIGVLDLDSDSYNSFDKIDKKYLEEIVKFLTEEIIN